MGLPIAREGLREILILTIILGACAAAAGYFFWPAAIVFGVLWIWVLAFFRDPPRTGVFQPGDLCSAADGTVTEITELDHHPDIGGQAVLIGAFLSLFNVHINRAPCDGRVTKVTYKPGKFLDARHPDSGSLNESNALVIETAPTMPGPVVVRQVAGLVARRIICHAGVGDGVTIGGRFGLIKFGSRTEVIIPRTARTEICVKVGENIRAGVTVLARQPIAANTPGAVPSENAAATNETVGSESDRKTVSQNVTE